MSFFHFSEKKSKNAAGTGTGYGGNNQDTSRLKAGRKQAEKKSDKEDMANVNFLRNTLKIIREKDGGIDGEEDKVKATLAGVFRNQIPNDWVKRRELYEAALDLTQQLCCKQYASLLGDAEDAETVLYWLVDFGNQAEQVLRHEATISTSNADIVARKDNSEKRAAKRPAPADSEEDECGAFARRVTSVRDDAARVVKQFNRKPAEELTMITFSERYQGELGPMRFDTVEAMDNVRFSLAIFLLTLFLLPNNDNSFCLLKIQHFFLKKVPTAPTTLDARKLFKELAAYKNALPVEYGSSCFCRVVNSRLDLLRVMITGPDGSPYANGCFFFDIILPSNYPQSAPKVQFLTTGGGKMRFNPNLYQCGKVCLSLLGTWNGPGWISGQSTLLQVLISIQSLILVPDPYFNEPGFESMRGTPRGNAHSEKYNTDIRRYTIDAAVNSHLDSVLNHKNPYPEFEAILVKHFLEKRSMIEVEFKSWAKQDASLKKPVQNVLDSFARLAAREKEAKRRVSRPKQLPYASGGNKSTDPITLDDSDVEEVIPPSKNKAGDTVEIIDLSDEESGFDSKPSAKVATKISSADDEVVDLT